MAACSASAGTSASSCTDAAQACLHAKKLRMYFTDHEDLCLLREVAAERPFGDGWKWLNVLTNVNRAVGREFTLRDIKDRVYLLIGDWMRQDDRNLEKSGTEEQYSEKEQILQDLSDYAPAVHYESRVNPGTASCTVRREGPGASGDRKKASTPAAEEPRAVVRFEEEAAGDGSYSAATAASQEAGSPAAQLLLSAYNQEPVLSPPTAAADGELDEHPTNQINSNGQERHVLPGQLQQQLPPSATTSAEKQQRQPASVQQLLTKGIRGLQSPGILLAMRERREFELRNKQLEIEKTKAENEGRRLNLEERKLALDEERHRFQVSCREADQQKLLEHIQEMFDEQNKKLYDLNAQRE